MWKAYAELEPFGAMADNLNFGILVSLLQNIYRAKGAKVVKPTEVALGDFTEDARAQSPEMMKEMLLAAFGTKVKRRKK